MRCREAEARSASAFAGRIRTASNLYDRRPEAGSNTQGRTVRGGSNGNIEAMRGSGVVDGGRGHYGAVMPRQSGPTIRTVAERAGVSTATVSYVLNGRRGGRSRVSEETSRRVLAAAEELGYVPDQSARGMRRGRTDLVCLALRRPHSPWAATLADTVAASVSQDRCSTLLLAGADWEGFLLRRGADAALVDLAGERAVAPSRLRRITDRGVSLVVLNEELEPDGFDVVRADAAEACDEVMRLLLTRHRRIAWLGGFPDEPPHRVGDEYGSYRRGLAAAGVPFEADLVRFTGASRERAYAETLSLLARPDRPGAVFAASDPAAISALWAARSLGIRVPEELAVVGVGNSAEGVAVEPPLTSVGPQDVFTAVAELLLSRLRGQAPEEGRLHLVRWTVHRRGTA